ncbi:unnamed protein product [Cochlearia groenlandica]
MSKQTNKELFLGGFVKVLKEQQKDVMLKALDSDDENAPISAHKLLLAARSEVFKKMLESDDECKVSRGMMRLSLPEMKRKELASFVEFLYSDGSMLSENAKEHVSSLYVASAKYEIPHLRDLCRTQLMSSITHLNALNVLELAGRLPFDKSLNDAALANIIANINVIVMSVEFKAFVVDHPNLTVEIVKAISMAKMRCFCGRSFCLCGKSFSECLRTY